MQTIYSFELPNGDIFEMDSFEYKTMIERYKELIGAVKTLPSSDRPQGEWIDKGWKGDWQFETDGRGHCWKVFECSVCNGWDTRKAHFCPHCGAYMKGEE